MVASALILIAGSAVLANRAGMGLLSSIFQNQSWEAKEAAEIGMTQVVSELNKETNRYLMVSRPGDTNGIWTTSDNPFIAATRTNPCTGATEPSYDKLDARTGASTASDTSYGTWYIQSNGEITRTQGSATRGFRITGVNRHDVEDKPLSIYANRPNGTGELTLQVEGLVFRGSTPIASAELEKVFELVPKCCKVSFGAAHGGLDYSVNATTNETICLGSASTLGLGLIAGAGLEGGSMRLIGSTTVEDTNNNDVGPVICIEPQNPEYTCNDTGNTSTAVARVDMTLPPVKTFAEAFNAPGAKKASESSTIPWPLQQCRAIRNTHDCPSNTGGSIRQETNLALRSENFTYCADESLGDCSITVINSGVSQAKLPTNCVISADNSTLHCNVKNLLYSNMVFATGDRKLMLYFPANDIGNAGVVRSLGGNAQIKHCTLSADQLMTADQATQCTSASGKDISRVSMFGCPSSSPTCGPQTVTLRGNNSTVGLFSYFPEGAMVLNGTPTYEGVMWGKTINAVGTANFVIPAAGLTSAFEMMGMIQENENDGPTDYGLPAFDFVARATNRYRWL